MKPLSFAIPLALLTFIPASPATVTAGQPATDVMFDLPPTVAAVSLQSQPPEEPSPLPAAAIRAIQQGSVVQVTLRLSSMVQSSRQPDISQWIVRCEPRDTLVSIVDYAPRTETASQLGSPIQVRRTDEDSNAFGMSADGGYGHLAKVHTGFDKIDKQSKSVQFEELAPEEAIIASGTVNRGRGVYFKLRWSAQQVLEGEKVFRLMFEVPKGWRGGLLDVSVEAQNEKRPLTPWERSIQMETITAERFVLAMYRSGDLEARRQAESLAAAEHALHVRLQEQQNRVRSGFSQVLHHVTRAFDLDQADAAGPWLSRLMRGEADPHMDRQIRDLPMEVRVAVLDYAEQRDAFESLSEIDSQRWVAAKPAIEK